MKVWPAIRPRSARAITSEGLFEGTIWECDDIGQFMIDEYLPEHLSPYLEFELEDVVADAKAIFEDINYDVELAS
jgi:hypothetical protein